MVLLVEPAASWDSEIQMFQNNGTGGESLGPALVSSPVGGLRRRSTGIPVCHVCPVPDGYCSTRGSSFHSC